MHAGLGGREPCIYRRVHLIVKIQTNSPGSGSSFSRIGAALPPSLDQTRRLIVRLSVIAVAVILAVIVASIWAGNRSRAAQVAFNNAMDVYDAPIQQAGQAPIPNVKSYSSAAARAKEANPLFRAVASKYGMFKAGENALYFAGLTAEDMGDNATAETDLKKASSFHDAGLSNLAKMALASLYTSTGRTTQAAPLYGDVIAHPTLTVSASAARLALANSEQSTNPQGARELYAKVKDTDKTTVAGQIATEKLNGK